MEMWNDIRSILFHETTILSRLDEMAREITTEYRGKPVTFVALLNGSFVFLADLLRRIPLPVHVDCIQVSSYAGTRSSGKLDFRSAVFPNFSGRHVLLMDDILDSGLTLGTVRGKIASQPGVRSVKTCVLLNKQVPRKTELEPDFSGFTIGNEFVVGYGLDYNEHYRNLPFIGVLSEEAIQKPASETK